MTRRAHHNESVMPLYPSEAEIARAILGGRADEWPAKAVILEREGLPKIDTFMGGRPWALVVRFFRAKQALDAGDEKRPDTPAASSRVRVMPFAPDGAENPNAESQRTYPHRRRAGGHGRRAGL